MKANSLSQIMYKLNPTKQEKMCGKTYGVYDKQTDSW